MSVRDSSNASTAFATGARVYVGSWANQEGMVTGDSHHAGEWFVQLDDKRRYPFAHSFRAKYLRLVASDAARFACGWCGCDTTSREHDPASCPKRGLRTSEAQAAGKYTFPTPGAAPCPACRGVAQVELEVTHSGYSVGSGHAHTDDCPKTMCPHGVKWARWADCEKCDG